MIPGVQIYYVFTDMFSCFVLPFYLNWAQGENTYCNWPTQYKYVYTYK